MKYLLVFLLFGSSFTLFAQTKKKTTSKKKTSVSSTVTKAGQTLSSAKPFTLSSLSETEIISGLKEALSVGSQNASVKLSALDGFNKNQLIRIPFPPEVAQVSSKLREMGLGSQIDDFETKLNRAAEMAAKDAAPIFTNAITQMSITDAKSILTGNNTAATAYLQGKTSDALFTTFSPTIKSALNNSLATSKWTEITTLYNRIPFITPVETDLVKYTTTKALAGLFVVVAEEEKKIRENPAARGTEILQKVFGSVNK